MEVAFAWATSISSQLMPLDETSTNRQLRRSELHGLLSHRLRDALQLEHHAARLDHRHPELRRPLALSHSSFRRLLRHRLLREDPDPHLAATLDRARDRHARGLELAIRDPCRLERLQTEVPEGHAAAAVGLAVHAAPLLLPIFHSLRHQHDVTSNSPPGLLRSCRD